MRYHHIRKHNHKDETENNEREIQWKLSERTLSYAGSSTYSRLDKTPFEL